MNIGRAVEEHDGGSLVGIVLKVSYRKEIWRASGKANLKTFDCHSITILWRFHFGFNNDSYVKKNVCYVVGTELSMLYILSCFIIKVPPKVSVVFQFSNEITEFKLIKLGMVEQSLLPQAVLYSILKFSHKERDLERKNLFLSRRLSGILVYFYRNDEFMFLKDFFLFERQILWRYGETEERNFPFASSLPSWLQGPELSWSKARS